jgi:hypothetical protein
MRCPIDEAKALFTRDVRATVSFEAVLVDFLQNPGCCVYTGPDAVGLAKQCRRDNPETVLLPRHIEMRPDTWFIWLAVGQGRMEALLRMLPYRLPWVAWQRHGRGMRVRWYRWEQVERMLKNRVED